MDIVMLSELLYYLKQSKNVSVELCCLLLLFVVNNQFGLQLTPKNRVSQFAD